MESDKRNEFYALLLLVAFICSCTTNDSNSYSTIPNYDTLIFQPKQSISKVKKDTIAVIENRDNEYDESIWSYDFTKSIPVKNKNVSSDTLNLYKLIRLIDNYEIHPEFVKISKDTIFVKIKDSTYLTQSIGSTGADEFMTIAIFTLTELKGIKYVNFDFEEGDHASPGTYCRQEILDRNK